MCGDRKSQYAAFSSVQFPSSSTIFPGPYEVLLARISRTQASAGTRVVLVRAEGATVAGHPSFTPRFTMVAIAVVLSQGCPWHRNLS